ncbi:MAG: tetratricopeptide repeat protein [Gammaproteobacteria bacterium]|jgi:tetratricopeptide (TPR) repeat protein|nr:tetratricopeptide repeat protein [Gammaproteobacteria bacterium]
MLRTFLICLLFLPVSVIADQSDERLDELFATLLISTDLTTIRSTENQIWEIWFNHANEDVEQLVQMGVTRMNYNRYAEAMLIFTQLIENFPDYAEGWNRRATLHYILGNLDESVADIEKVLELEPRHFGALSGLGLVFLQQKQLSKAKQAFENLVDLHPNSPNAQENLRRVTEDIRLNVI